MHCPKCSAFLEAAEGGTLRCSRVGWVYSEVDSGLLREQFGNQPSIAPPTADREQESVGSWYCPGCGVLMREDVCPHCQKRIDGRLLYRLVERNQHP